MDKLRRMALFARVVETGAMSAAARELGMSPSAVSQQIRQLEGETGVALLHRSTRKLTLSEAGAAFYEGCAAMVAAAKSAEQRLAELRDAAVGELRIAAPVGFAGTHLAGALGPLLQHNPGLKLRLFIDDRRIDLIEERIDLAIRIGTLADSSLVARELASWEMVLCAAPSYLARIGIPKTPEELMMLDWLVLTVLETPHQLELSGPKGQSFRARVEARVASTNSRSLREMALAGAGIARQPLPDVEKEIAEGKLIRLLPDWLLPPVGVYAVTPQRDAQPAKVRHAIEALRRYLAR
jgi:DNA-binding transcriptional LysR family regulator